MKKRKSILRIAIVLALLCVVPVFLPSYYTGLLTLILIYAIFAMSLDILQGYTGLASLGHAAFLGTGAYIVAIINVKVFHGPHFAIELPAGVLAAAVVAALIGLIVLRNTGTYLLMILLASSMMLWGIAFKWRSLTGGDDGLPGIARPDLAFMHWNLHNTTDFYYFVLLFFVIASVLDVSGGAFFFRPYVIRHSRKRNAYDCPGVQCLASEVYSLYCVRSFCGSRRGTPRLL